ncbi:MAG: glycerol-3-phosphate dehydrogenase/oxidase [Sideroxydans sp.]
MKRDVAALNDSFDLLVCGGGIYGAWTAYDAALRGLKVALVERADWASATSSASSKLIHGGLRYLETHDFALVRKALHERERLLQLAPHRVWPLRFAVPLYEKGRHGWLELKAGLTLYDVLAGFPGESMRHGYLGQQDFVAHFPFLEVAGLRGGFTYGDAQTDDARLVLELVAGAQAAGAVCVNYVRLLAWNESGGKVCGATVQDEASGTVVSVAARQCVDTSGQWLATSEAGHGWCRLSKGVHLVLPAMPTDEAMLLTTRSDGRVFFLIPWYGRTLLGTTDTDFRGDVNRVAVEIADMDYLLDAANDYLQVKWTRQDVIAGFAGLRVLKSSDAAHPSLASRDWEIRTEVNGLHHSVGGKLTSAREDAREIVDKVCAHLQWRQPCMTGETPLPWYAPPDELARLARHAEASGVDGESARWLVRRHGSRTPQVLGLIEKSPELAQRVVQEVPLILADLMHCAEHEMVLAWPDLVRRRLPLTILARLDGAAEQALARQVAAASGRQIGLTQPVPRADFSV